MKTDIIITKVWSDEFSTEFNVKFKTLLNYEDFVVSGNYYISKKQLEQLAKNLSKASGTVIFGSKESKDYCELSVGQSEMGYKNINFHMVKEGEYYELIESIDLTLNTGYVIEPAILDRIVPRLENFYDEAEGSKISLMNEEN